jgi:peptidoglycan/xylan/chitin deacetylase (PgdA/CDA1 family)
MDYCQKRPDFLKPPEIRALAGQGFDFGTHGVTHTSLPHMPPDRMRAELATSKAWLEDVLGRRVDVMTIPTGERSDALTRAAWEHDYRFLGNSVEQMNRPRALPAEINRFVVLAHHDGAAVCRMAAGDPAYIAWRRFRQALLYVPTRLLKVYDEVRT